MIKQIEQCGNCGQPIDDWNYDCGGHCLECMIELTLDGDPDVHRMARVNHNKMRQVILEQKRHIEKLRDVLNTIQIEGGLGVARHRQVERALSVTGEQQ